MPPVGWWAMLWFGLIPWGACSGQTTGPTPLGPELPVTPYRLHEVTVIGDAVPAPVGAGNVTLLPETTLGERGLTSPRDLGALAPNLMLFDANGDRLPRFSVRGLRENNFSYGETAVAVYVDDVPYFDSLSRGVPFVNLTAVEFLPGPQGTTLGASRPGGVLNLYTRLPDSQWRGFARGSGGNYEAVSLAGGASGPVKANRVAAGLDGYFAKRDGYIENLATGRRPDTRETLAGRAQVRWTPTDSLDCTFALDAHRYRDGALVARRLDQLEGFHQVRQDFDGANRQESLTWSCRAAWFGESVRVINALAWRDWRQDLTGDFDFSPFPVTFGYDRPRLSQWSEEVRVLSADEDARVRWSCGAFVSGHDLERNNGYTFGPAAPAPPLVGARHNTFSEAEDLDLAVFGHVVWRAVEPLEFTVGLRGEYDRRETRRGQINPLLPPFQFPWRAGRDFWSVQPRVAATYHFSTNLQTWGAFTTGHQPGGWSVSANTVAAARFDAATSQHYELGVRGQCRDGHLAAALTGFWIQYQDYQVYRPVSLTEYRVLNAPEARAFGAEAEVWVRPATGWEFRLSAGHTHAEFERFVAPDSITAQPRVLDGKRINFVPEFTLDATARYRHRTGWFGQVGVTGVGEFWFDESNDRQQAAYALLHGRVGWAGRKVEIAAFGENLLDREYYANVLDLRPQPGFIGTPGDPVTFGIELTARF